MTILLLLIIIMILIGREENNRPIHRMGYGTKPTTSRPEVRPRPQPK